MVGTLRFAHPTIYRGYQLVHSCHYLMVLVGIV